MTRPARVVWLIGALLVGAGCGKKDEARPTAAPTSPSGLAPTPAPPPAGPPVAPPPLDVLPVTVTMEEITACAPTVAALRVTTPLADDGSGKQVRGAACLPASDVKVALHQVADALGVAGWILKTRETTKGDTRGEVIADRDLTGATLHARAVIAARPSCAAGEFGVDLFYSKLAPAPKPAAPPAPSTPAPRAP